MTRPFPPLPIRRPVSTGAVLLALVLTGCSQEPVPTAGPTSAVASTEATGEVSPSTSVPGQTTTAPNGTSGPDGSSATAVPSGNDVAPYDDTATRDAAARFGAPQPLPNGLEAEVEGPRPATTGERAVRAAPGTPVQVFTVTLTNTGPAPVDAVPWSFPVAVSGGEPAVPAFDESLGVRMETFPTIAPGESASLDVAFSASADADLAVRLFDTTDPAHYVEFTA